MKGYRNLINNHAFNQLPLTADIPDYRLSIGYAENLESVPILLFTDYYAPIQRAILPTYQQQGYENFIDDFSGDKITMEDFPTNEFWLGSSVVGV
jgi:hypothetical protein